MEPAGGGGVPGLGGVTRETVKSRSSVVVFPAASITRTVNWWGPAEKEPGLIIHWNGALESTKVSWPSTQNSTRFVETALPILTWTSAGEEITAPSERPVKVASGGTVLGTVTTRSSKVDIPE